MYSVPVWIQQVILLIALPLAVEGGYQLQRDIARRRARSNAPDVGEEEWGQITAASMSLLGLLLAFTVSMAVNHYETRRGLVVDEANAISTAYLRAQLFDDPARSQLSAQLVKFARDRELIFSAGDDPVRINRAEMVTDDNETQLWRITAVALRQPRDGMWAPTFLPAMNGMFDLAATRQRSLEARIPPRVVRVSVIYALVTAAIVGYSLGAAHTRRRASSTLIFVMVAMTIGLILDLDHPRSGAITVPEAPLTSVTESIVKAESAKTSGLGQAVRGSVSAASPAPAAAR